MSKRGQKIYEKIVKDNFEYLKYINIFNSVNNFSKLIYDENINKKPKWIKAEIGFLFYFLKDDESIDSKRFITLYKKRDKIIPSPSIPNDLYHIIRTWGLLDCDSNANDFDLFSKAWLYMNSTDTSFLNEKDKYDADIKKGWEKLNSIFENAEKNYMLYIVVFLYTFLKINVSQNLENRYYVLLCLWVKKILSQHDVPWEFSVLEQLCNAHLYKILKEIIKRDTSFNPSSIFYYVYNAINNSIKTSLDFNKVKKQLTFKYYEKQILTTDDAFQLDKDNFINSIAPLSSKIADDISWDTSLLFICFLSKVYMGLNISQQNNEINSIIKVLNEFIDDKKNIELCALISCMEGLATYEMQIDKERRNKQTAKANSLK